MSRILRRRLAGAGAAVLLLASLGVPVAQAAVVQTADSVGSPYTVLGRPAGQLYAGGVSGADRTRRIRAMSGPSMAGPQTPPSRLVKPGWRPDDRAIRPLTAPAPTLASQSTAPDNHAPGFVGLAASNEPSPTTEPANSTVAVGPD